MKIEEAKYIVDGSTVKASKLTKYDYFKKYRGYLKCMEDDCSALLSFVERKINNSKYFRTWSKSPHKEGCPYEVMYDDESSIANGDNPENLANLTDKHIMDRLKRAYENLFIGKPFIKHERKTTNNKITSKVGSIIHPALFGEGSDTAGKQPYILVRQFNKLDESDYNQVRCVIGRVISIQLHEEHGYINLTRKQPESVLHFHLFKDFLDKCKKDKIDVICCCIGKVIKVNSGINICPDRYNAFILNGLSYYDLFRNSAGL